MYKITGLFFCLLLTGCEAEPVTYDSLMQNPSRLQKESVICQQNEEPQCNIVRQAAQNFLQLINERRDDPEKFGQEIIQIQISLSELAKQPGTKEMYQQQEKKLRILFAVVAATSVE